MAGEQWWRVELDESGSVLTCEAVAGPAKGGRLLAYVQGATLAEAKLNVKSWYLRYRAQQAAYAQRRFDKRREAGLCPRDYACCTGLPEDGKKTCRACREAKAAQRRRYEEHGRTRPKANPAQARLNWARHRGNKRLTALSVLKQFDTLGPTRFREWLLNQINEGTRQTLRKLASDQLLAAHRSTKRAASGRPGTQHAQH